VQAIRDDPDWNVPNLAAILAADIVEKGFFKEATTEVWFHLVLAPFQNQLY
jgi:hypothetical protein